MMRTILTAVAIAVTMTITSPVAFAASPAATDLTDLFRSAGASVDRLQVYEIAGIVIIRGQAASHVEAAQTGAIAQSLGYARVANLIQVIEHRDDEIARAAQMELAVHRSLDGCRFIISSENGIVTVAGHVQHELQKDVAAAVLRSIDGVQGVELALERF